MKKLILSLIASSLPLLSIATTPLWLRDGQISPDGKSIAFTYKGDIWTVSTIGGTATRLTTQPSYEAEPLWSPDSKQIAFVSDRYGNFDIFIVPAQGGNPTRLTYNSASESPIAFTPDGKSLLYGASIQDPAESALFPSSRLTEVYQVPIKGGPATQVLATPARHISFIPGGNGAFLYQDVKAMENYWRKHHTSSITCDIWMYQPDKESNRGKHTPLVTNPGEDRNPVVGNNGDFYFLSERNGGSMNVYQANIADASSPKKITNFKDHPVRFLSRSSDGTLCFGYDGEIYTMGKDGKPKKVVIDLIIDDQDEAYKSSMGKPSEIAVSPDGNSIALVWRGEVFVTSVDYRTTNQITHTPAAERNVTWSPDSKTLYYTSERDGKYNIYKATMGHEGDQNFANATIVNEEPLFKSDEHERAMPKISPDGKMMAFILDRTKLAIKNLSDGKVTTITDGKEITNRNGFFEFSWSPDSKWIAMEVVDRKHDPYTDIAIISVEDGSMTNLTSSGYFDESPRWVLGGNAIIFASERYGMRNHASWGSMQDVMIVFLNQKAYDNFLLNKEDAELAEKEEKNKDKDEDKDKEKDKEDKTIVVELDRIQDRVVRITPFSSDLSDAYIVSDGKKMYFITESADNNMLWELDLRSDEVSMSKTISSGLKHFEVTPDGKNVFIVGSQIQKFNPSGNKLTPVNFSATVKLDPAAEREYMYDYMVREEQARFYTPDMHGVNWKQLTDHYRKFLPHINNNYDFSEMLSEILGELNVSHTGSGYRPSTSSQADRTASLGLLYDLAYTGNGLMVAEVIEGGPFDIKSSKVKPGVVVEKIGGEEITPQNDYTLLLCDLQGKKTLVSLFDPATNERWSEVVKPISSGAMNTLLYDRWVKGRAAFVDKISNGRLAYVHVKSMNDDSFRKVYSDLLGKYNDREGVVIDIRYNGGGRLHEDLEILFSGQKYLTQVVRGQDVCDMPSRRWNKPSIMVTCEACYSNAHGSPWVYQHQGLGKVVGMPVPGTMTSVNWVTLQDPTLYFGIPVVGYRTAEGYYLENHQLTPDVIVNNDPADIVIGEDSQLRRAVEELLKDIDSKH